MSEYPRLSREERRRLLSRNRSRELAQTVGVSFGAAADEGAQPPGSPDYYSISADDRRVLEKAIDDTRSPDPSLRSRAQTAMNNVLSIQYSGTILSKALASLGPLGAVANATVQLYFAFAGFKVRGEFEFSPDAVVFEGSVDPAYYGENLGRVIVTKATYDPLTGEARVEGVGAASPYGCDPGPLDPDRVNFGWRSGVVGLTNATATEYTEPSPAISTGVTSDPIGYTCDNILDFFRDNPDVLGPDWEPRGEADRRTNALGTATLATHANIQLCGYDLHNGVKSGWSCRNLDGEGGTMPSGDLEEMEPGLPDDPTDIPLNVPETQEVIDCLKDPTCHNSGWEAPGPCDPTDIGADPGTGTPIGGGIIDDGGGTINLPDEPPGYNDPTKPGGIGDGHRPGDEVCVEVASGFRVVASSISAAARSCLLDGTEQAWEVDDPGILVPPRDGGCMDYAPGAACIDALKAEGWVEAERTETIVRVCPPRTDKWFERGRRCGPIERIGPGDDGGIRIDLPPCVPNHTRFEERTCYGGMNQGVATPIQDAIEDVLRDMRIDMDRVYFDSESDLVLRRPVCFPPAMRKAKALHYLLDLAGWGIFPAPDCTIIIGLDDPLPKVWVYHEDVDLLRFELEWDRYEVFANVMISRADIRSRGGKLLEKGFSRMVPVPTPISVEPDKIFPMHAPRGMSEAEAVQAARMQAQQIARKGLPIIQFAVPHNYRMRKRHQIDIVRPTKGFRARYMVTKLARDIDRKEGDLTVGQARWIVPETTL